MESKVLFKVCFVSPGIYPLFNHQAGTTYGDAETQLYELAAYFGKQENFEVSVVTDDFGQDEVEFYSGVLVYKAKFTTRSGFMQWLIPSRNPLFRLLDKINAQIYIMAGASGIAKEIAEFCLSKKRIFLFRISHQRECDGTFSRGMGEEGEKFLWALKKSYVVICQTQDQKALLQRKENISAIRFSNAIMPHITTDTDRKEVVWIGEAVSWKQPEYFFRLALSVPEHQFTFITTPKLSLIHI